MSRNQFASVFLSLATSTLLLLGCQKQSAEPATDEPTIDEPTTNAPNLRPLTAAERSTVGSANDFAFRAFAALRSRTIAAENLCISPLSVSAALTMAYNGADGSTKAAMKETLGFTPQTDAEVNGSYKSLFELLTGIDKKVTFTTANSIWHGKQYQLATPFVQQNHTSFGATVQAVDFALPTAKDAINSWVSGKTQGKISDIIQQTSADDVMYLVNALYFKGSWTYRIDPQLTRPAPFTLEDGQSKTVNMMRLTKGKYLRYADAQQQVIDLPYGNRQYSMTLVVPRGQTTLASVASRLTGAQLSTWLAGADTTSLELRLPKFRLEYEKQLNDALTSMGMGVAFTNQANFSRMLAGNATNLKISAVKHKTYLDVNEEGTEAAAVTSVGVITTSVPQPVEVNRPFLFLLREKSSNAILFIGQVTNP
ncbi:serpin family protein [Hymenobacter arizonensis]|uniref:Serpin B n=1 Tax=Hymenobacter arizonensis TaxID=1227077 RepID=A0A1I5ZSY6_HYMAR|nr:serpin family protein [Hymenobacter arizonensis]SFQ59473.1 serpin B [Hymenobacter arizonensis]